MLAISNSGQVITTALVTARNHVYLRFVLSLSYKSSIYILNPNLLPSLKNLGLLLLRLLQFETLQHELIHRYG